MFEQKYEKYQNFCLKIFHFLAVKFSIYLNRHVFVMTVQLQATDSLNNDVDMIITIRDKWYCAAVSKYQSGL